GKITETQSSPGAHQLAATSTPGLDFVAVDVETANGNWASICQIGAVRFVAGEETESKVWLCQPPAGIEHFEDRSEEHTSELQSRFDLVCRLLLEKKKET